MTAITADILNFALDRREFPAPKKGMRGMLAGAFARARDTVVEKVVGVKNAGIQIGHLAKTAAVGADAETRKKARGTLGKAFAGVALSVAQKKAQATVLGAVVSTIGLPAVLIGAGAGAFLGASLIVYADYQRYKKFGSTDGYWGKKRFLTALRKSPVLSLVSGAVGAGLGVGLGYGLHSLRDAFELANQQANLAQALSSVSLPHTSLPALPSLGLPATDGAVSFVADMPSVLDDGAHFADTRVLEHGDLLAPLDLAKNYDPLQYNSRVRPYSFALFDPNAQSHVPQPPLTPAPTVVAHHDVTPVPRPEDTPRPALSTAELAQARAESLERARAWTAAQTHSVPDTIPAAAPAVETAPAAETSSVLPRDVKADAVIYEVERGVHQVATHNNNPIVPGGTVRAKWGDGYINIANTGDTPVKPLDLIMNKLCGHELNCNNSGLDTSGMPKNLDRLVAQGPGAAQLVAAAP